MTDNSVCLHQYAWDRPWCLKCGRMASGLGAPADAAPAETASSGNASADAVWSQPPAGAARPAGELSEDASYLEWLSSALVRGEMLSRATERAVADKLHAIAARLRAPAAPDGPTLTEGERAWLQAAALTGSPEAASLLRRLSSGQPGGAGTPTTTTEGGEHG